MSKLSKNGFTLTLQTFEMQNETCAEAVVTAPNGEVFELHPLPSSWFESELSDPLDCDGGKSEEKWKATESEAFLDNPAEYLKNCKEEQLWLKDRYSFTPRNK